MTQRVLIAVDIDWLQVVPLADYFGLVFKHGLVEEGAQLCTHWRVLKGRAEGQTGIVNMCEVPDGLAKPSPVLRFIFLI